MAHENESSVSRQLKIIECPRDAMQGWPHFIETKKKIDYLNALLRAGFDTIDFGSFVSAKAIPQMADSAEVIRNLEPGKSATKLLAIVANARGADDAAAFEKITYLGFPLSVSETFQQKNTNSSVDESMKRVAAIREICLRNNKQLVVYISMGFGNPYGDAYDHDSVLMRARQLSELGVNIISLADTVGLATATEISALMNKVIPAFPSAEIGVHLHSAPAGRKEKIAAALSAGCRRFDSAIKGIGGCPMAGDDLVGNMDTEVMLDYFNEQGYETGIDNDELMRCSHMAAQIFD